MDNGSTHQRLHFLRHHAQNVFYLALADVFFEYAEDFLNGICCLVRGVKVSLIVCRIVLLYPFNDGFIPNEP